MAFWFEILSTDKPIDEENVLKISAQDEDSFLRYYRFKNGSHLIKDTRIF